MSTVAAEPIAPVESSPEGDAPVAEAPNLPNPTSGEFRRRFTVADLDRLDAVGFFRPGERFELIEGDLVPMSRIKGPHARCVGQLNEDLIFGLARRAIVRVQDPIHISEKCEPEPDLAVAHLRDDRYQTGHPGPADLFLVIEVMDTSGPYDRGVKIPLYAGAGIVETWLIDLPGDLIEVHRNPVEGAYSERLLFRRGQTVAPQAFPDLVLTVDSILSRPES